MENKQNPEEATKEQKLLNPSIGEGEIIENQTQEITTEKISNTVKSEPDKLIQEPKSELPLEQTKNLPSELLAPRDSGGLFQSIQDKVKVKIGMSSPPEIQVTKIKTQRSKLETILHWLQNLKPGNVINLRDIDTISNAIPIIDKLLLSYSNLIQEHESLRGEAARLKSDLKISQEEARKYQRQIASYSQFQHDNKLLKSHNAALKNENVQLKQDYNNLKNERDVLISERGRILGELAAKNRDKSTTYTTSIGGDASLQHHILYQEFKQLKEQEFNVVSNEMFRYRCEKDPALKVNRKQEIATIKAVLTKQVIINGMKLFTGNTDFPPEAVENVLKAISESCCRDLEMAEKSEFPEAISNELDSLIKQVMKLLSETNSAGISKHSWNLEEFTTSVKDISKSVYNALKMPEETDIPETIRISTENLVRKSLELVKKIASADPPGILWIEKEGIPFQSDRHEAMLGCEEGGKIWLTVYPGYLVGDRVFEKALVFTVP
ncbi:MAG: hypothetical protein DSM106950_09710 [Stigonema ocellatum SAG 48.90 = DSM 106950]|nr:hypothetical protein [Stigonema ocellatum SAG 48.90 = DSM 106950]